MTPDQFIVRKCEGCMMCAYDGLAYVDTCTAFRDPAFQHRDGRQCWGRCDSVGDMMCRLQAMVAYNPRSKVLQRELEEWIGPAASATR